MTQPTDEELAAEYRAWKPRAKLGGRGKQVEENRDVLAAAVERARDTYLQHDEVYVSFSGGKDSTATLGVALIAARQLGKLPLKVVFWDEEAIPYEVEDYVRRVAAHPDIELEWLCLPILHRNACSTEHPHWSPWAPEHEDLWCRPMPPEARSEAKNCPDWWTFQDRPAERPSIPVASSVFAVTRPGTVAEFIGNRADESLRRRSIILRRAFTADAHVTHRTTYGVKNLWLVYPIYDWSTTDVWTFIANEQIDYCEYYDTLEMLGVPRAHQRLGPPFGEEPLMRLWTYREIDPRLWDKLSRRVPGANTAAMYSKTLLYGYGGGDDQHGATKPPDKTWQQALSEAIEAHDPVTRKAVAQWVRMWMTKHFRATAQPILEVPHPKSGISWPWLYRLALRGDMKKRREPPYPMNAEQYTKYYRNYANALAEHEGTNDDGQTPPAGETEMDPPDTTVGERVEPEPSSANRA